MVLTEEDSNGLKEIRALFDEFLQSHKIRKADERVLVYLTETTKSDEILLSYLWGRKYRAKYAWETIKRNAEVRFHECPELFPAVIPNKIITHVQSRNILGVLKSRDCEGRRVLVCNGSAWDPDICSLEDLMVFIIPLMEQLLKHEDTAKQGISYIQECSGQQFKHARQYSLSAIKKLIKLFWHSFPVQLKMVHYVNALTIFYYSYTLAKPLLPTKLKERLIVSPIAAGFQETHQLVPPDKLPTFLGGSLSYHEAIDESFVVK